MTTIRGQRAAPEALNLDANSAIGTLYEIEHVVEYTYLSRRIPSRSSYWIGIWPALETNLQVFEI